MIIINTIMTDNNNDDHNNENANDKDDDDDDDNDDNDIDNNNNRYAYAFSTRRCCDAQCIWECVGSSTFLCLGEVTDVSTETLLVSLCFVMVTICCVGIPAWNSVVIVDARTQWHVHFCDRPACCEILCILLERVFLPIGSAENHRSNVTLLAGFWKSLSHFSLSLDRYIFKISTAGPYILTSL